MFLMSSFLLSLLSFTNVAFAEDSPTIYQNKTEVDFEALDIEGELKKPPGQLIMSRDTVVFNPLLPPRLHFNNEMMQSINDVK